MKRKCASLLIIFTLALIILACGGGGTTTAPTPEPPPTETPVPPTSTPTLAPPTPIPTPEPISQWATDAAASSQYSDPDWSALQATGAPDTGECGDYGTAWAAAASGTVERLDVYYETPVYATEINIVQTYHPDQVAQVDLIDLDGESVLLYTQEPAAVQEPCPYVLTIETEQTDFLVQGVRITIDQSVLGLGWNEIDAVELRGVPGEGEATRPELEQGREYAEQGELDKAIAEFEQAIELNPNDAVVYNDLAAAYYQQGRIDEAITTWEEAISIDPELADAHYNLGLAYAEQDKFDEAVIKWEKTIQIDPNYANAYKNLGIAYTEQGRIEEAIAGFETYLELKPDAEDRTAVEGEIAKLKEQPAASATEHRNVAGGYSLRYPEGWYITENETTTSLAPSQEDYVASTLQSPLFTLVTWRLAQAIESFGLAEGDPPAEYLQVMSERLEAETDQIESRQILGYPAAVAATTGTLEGSPYEGELIVILVEDTFFLAEGLAPPDQWADARPTFVDVINSLTFFTSEE